MCSLNALKQYCSYSANGDVIKSVITLKITFSLSLPFCSYKCQFLQFCHIMITEKPENDKLFKKRLAKSIVLYYLFQISISATKCVCMYVSVSMITDD